jgi:hypothetical protein
MPKEIKINYLKRMALDGKKSRESLIGKKVKYIGYDITKQIKTNEVYIISDISSGNYDSFIYLEELPKERYSEYSRKVVPNCFDIDKFELV